MRRPPSPLALDSSALGQLAAALAEALLLVMAAEAVLLFDPYATRWADFVKTTHLRTLAMLLAVLWAICAWAERHRDRWVGAGFKPAPTGERIRRFTPAVLFTLALAGVAGTMALATSLSIAPEVSLWGDRRLTTGLVSVVAWLVVGGTAATVLRSGAQVERLLRTLLLATLSATLYGLLEVLGMSPLAAVAAQVERTNSTLGNPIFFGSLVVLTLPIALAWLWLTVQLPAPPDSPRTRARTGRASLAPVDRALPRARETAGKGDDRKHQPSVLAWLTMLLGQQVLFFAWLSLVGAYLDAAWFAPAILVAFVWLGVLLPPPRLRVRFGRPLAVLGLGLLAGALLIALVFTRARGPFLGAAVALALVAVWIVQPTWRRWAVAALPALGLALAVLSIFAGSSLVVPTAWLSGRSPENAALSVESRLLAWQTVATLIVRPPALAGAAHGAPVPRLLIGYGPDTLRLATEQVYPRDLRKIEGPARLNSSHNDVLDHVFTVGLLGTAAWLALVASVLWAARRAYEHADGRRRILLGGVLAGLLGYAVEQMVAPAYPPVRTLAWLLGGALVGLARDAGATPCRGVLHTPSWEEQQPAPRGLGWPVGFAVATFAVVLALPSVSPPDQLAVTATSWWLWALAGAGGLAWALAPPATRQLRRPALLASLLLGFAASALLAGQALRPLVAERLGSAAEGARGVGDYRPAVWFATLARSAWPADERYDFLLGSTLIELAGAPTRAGDPLPQRLPQPAPPSEPFDIATVAQATPERLLDWGVWLVERAAERQPLEFEYPLSRAVLYQRLADLLQSPQAREEAARALARAQQLSPTNPRVLQLAAELGR